MRLARPTKPLERFIFRVRWVVVVYDDETTLVRMLGRDRVDQRWVYFQIFRDETASITRSMIRKMVRGDKDFMKRRIKHIQRYNDTAAAISFCEQSLEIIGCGRGRAWRKSKSKPKKRKRTR